LNKRPKISIEIKIGYFRFWIIGFKWTKKIVFKPFVKYFFNLDNLKKQGFKKAGSF